MNSVMEREGPMPCSAKHTSDCVAGGREDCLSCMSVFSTFLPSAVRSFTLINLLMVSPGPRVMVHKWDSRLLAAVGDGDTQRAAGRPASGEKKSCLGHVLPSFLSLLHSLPMKPKVELVGRRRTDSSRVGLLCFVLDCQDPSLWGWAGGAVSLVSTHVDITNILILWPRSEMPISTFVFSRLPCHQTPGFSFQFPEPSS